MRARWPGRAVVLAAVLVTACQPWYRDPERRGRAALDTRRTERELAEARAAHARGQHVRAAAILHATVRRSPVAESDVWLLLGEVEAAAGQAAKGRASVAWRLRQLEPSHPDAPRLRAFLVSSLATDGLIAQALDLVQPSTLAAAMQFDALASPLRDLSIAARQAPKDPESALHRLAGWLESYGEPDHAILRDAREQITATVWPAASVEGAPAKLAQVRRLGTYARDELAAGRVASAVGLYAGAYRLWPAVAFEPYRAEMERAAVTVDPATANPEVYALAADADAALQRGELGQATLLYRRAVARAPWWTQARHNLTALLALDRVY